MNQALSQEMYTSGSYESLNPTWHAEDAEWKADNITRLLKEAQVEPQSVCEIGCGIGGVAAILSDRYPDTSFKGFDISAYAVGIASKQAKANLSFQEGSPFGGDRTYDLAMALDVFEHVEDYFGFLRHMKKLSRYQIYNIPLDLSVRSMIQPSHVIGGRERLGHLHYFTKETALATLVDTGHEVVSSFLSSKSLVYREVRGSRWPMVFLRRRLFAMAPGFTARFFGNFSLTVLCR